jgi:hypothetical protein
LWIVFSLLCVSVAYAQRDGEREYVRIENPKDGQAVGDVADIEGKVSDPNAKVWVIVRPQGTTQYWVQPPAEVEENGKWFSIAHIGRLDQDFGKKFQIRAVANPRVELHEGKVFSSWPSAALSSNIVTVVKTRQAD